jgi:hypothetical protein
MMPPVLLCVGLLLGTLGTKKFLMTDLLWAVMTRLLRLLLGIAELEVALSPFRQPLSSTESDDESYED